MPHEMTAPARRGASGLTLIEMSMLIALVGVAVIGLAERQLIGATQSGDSVARTIEDIHMVTDALQAWARDNTPRRWPYHLYSLVSGCNHATVEQARIIDAIPVMELREYYYTPGACQIFRPNVTGGYLFNLPESRFHPPSGCTAESGGTDCEYRFDKSGWEMVNGVLTPPAVSEGVTVQFVIERADSASVEQLARQIALASPNVTTVPVPGTDHRRIIRFTVFTPMSCVGEPNAPYEADPLVYRCREGRVVRFERGDLRGVRRIALREGQSEFTPYSSRRESLDTTPLLGPGITLPATPRYAISYQMRIGTQGVGRDQYLELIRDKVPNGGVCTSAERFGNSTCLTTNFPLTWANVNRFSPSAGIALRGYAGLPTNSNEPADPALWLHYGGGNARQREIWDFDRDPLVRLRISNRVMDTLYHHRSGQTVERDAHHDLQFGTRIAGSGRAEPYMHLCADHAWANTTARIDTRRSSFGGHNQYVDEPCKTGVVLGMDYRGNHWDISLSAEPGHRSLQTRLCALETAASGVARDSSC